eukprot:Gb_27493 [translate_table: standard]
MGSRVLQAIVRQLPLKRQHPMRSLCSCNTTRVYSTFQPSSSGFPFRPPASQFWLSKTESLSSTATRFFSDSTGSSRVLVVNSDAEFSSALSKAQDNQGLAIVYFTATWCGPCKTISPIVDNLSTNYSKATFLKVDVDQENLVKTLGSSDVTSVPTFHFYKNGAKVSDLIGADAARLKEIVGNLSK